MNINFSVDTVVLLGYFAIMILVGWVFRSFTKTTSDYFRGGGQMLWWLVGSTAFLTQFSAWSFTGAANKAFTDGFSIMVIFLANAFGYFLNWAYFAQKFRQLRVVTPVQAIKMRFGKTNEQAFLWGSMPNSIVSAAIWLNGLAIFASQLLGLSVETTIVLCGSVVLFISLVGGAWAVTASDFMQTVIIMATTVVAGITALVLVGGPTKIVEDFPVADMIVGRDVNYISIFIFWCIFAIIKQFFITNNMMNSYRYLAAKDSKNARKAALLACILMLFGPLIWFFPPWAMAIFVDQGTIAPMAELYPELGNKAGDAVYVAFVANFMPVGMLGVLVAAMFSATMSSMDSSLNRSSGLFVLNFYKPVINPNATEKQLMKLSYFTTFILGITVILVAIFIASLRHLSLFDIMLQVGALLGMPLVVAPCLGFFIHRTPDWSGWSTLLVGAIVSYVVKFHLTPDFVSSLFNVSFTGREASDLVVLLGIAAHVFITGGFFVSTSFFYDRSKMSKERNEEIDEFNRRLSTPVVQDTIEQKNLDGRQQKLLGTLVSIMGLGLLLLLLVPNSLAGRFAFVACGGIVLAIGFLLIWSSSKTYADIKNEEKTS